MVVPQSQDLLVDHGGNRGLLKVAGLGSHDCSQTVVEDNADNPWMEGDLARSSDQMAAYVH